jgi:hypothetical protein
MVAGDCDVAEALATQALELGLASSEPDAAQFYGAQVIAIRVLQGRGEEMVGLVEQGVADSPLVSGYRFVLAMLYSEIGRLDEARALIATEIEAAFANVAREFNWLDNMHFFSETIARLGLPDSARAIYDLISPYADQLPSTDLISFDILHLDLANLAATFGDFDRAESHFAASHEAHERIGAKHSLAKTQACWAAMLLTRRHSADRSRARDLAERALASAEHHGYGAVARRAAAVLSHE